MVPPPPSTPAIEDAFPPGAEYPDGVDLILIQWFLTLTPYERLEYLEDWVAGITELQNGRVTEPQRWREQRPLVGASPTLHRVYPVQVHR